MKQESIKNEYDGPRSPVKLLSSGRFNLDYANSDDAGELDTGIRETITGIRLSILAVGIGLAKIRAKGLYIDLNHHSMAKYIESLCEEFHMERSGLHNWLYIGETFLKYRKELEKIGFSEENGPTKLPYVERALAIYKKKNDVFRAVKDMSLRQFVSFSRGEVSAPKESAVRVKGGRVYLGKKLAVTVSKDLDPKTKSYLEEIILKAGEALEAKEVLYTTRLYDMDELKRFERAAERLKKELRGKR